SGVIPDPTGDAMIDAPFSCVGSQIASDPPTTGGEILFVRAAGLSPNAPAGTTTTDSVVVSWTVRALAGNQQYAAIRTVCGSAADLATTQPCTPATIDSCVACKGALTTCVDLLAPPSPAIPRY